MKAVNRELTLQRCLTETRIWLTINYMRLCGKVNTATFFKYALKVLGSILDESSFAILFTEFLISLLQ